MNRSKIPIENILKEIEKESTKIVRETLDEITTITTTLMEMSDPIVIQALKNYCIIRTVSEVENCIKSIVIEMIDTFHYDVKVFDEIKFSLMEFHDLRHNDKITLGKIIVNHHRFQNTQTIDSVMSKLLNNESFLNKVGTHYEEIKNLSKINTEPFDFEYLEKLFHHRHDIIHRLSAEHDISFEYLNRIFVSGWLFMIFAVNVSKLALMKKYPSSTQFSKYKTELIDSTADLMRSGERLIETAKSVKLKS